GLGAGAGGYAIHISSKFCGWGTNGCSNSSNYGKIIDCRGRHRREYLVDAPMGQAASGICQEKFLKKRQKACKICPETLVIIMTWEVSAWSNLPMSSW
ncbi:MAG: hypothetical protein IKM70_03425, partial [Firmicutes bacterium]|nr:hypothetical protein [Bacillota bacterium]